jgi:DNA-binding NtrC family response regulator
MESKGVVLIIDDEKQLRGLLKRIVELEDYTVFEAGDLKSAWQVLERQPIKVVMSDVKLPDGNGVDFTAKLKSQYPHLEIIVMTAYGTIQDGVKAMKNGAFDYLVKGDDNEKMIPMLDLAMQKANQAKTSEVSLTGFDKVIGKTSIIENAVNMAKRVAQTSTTVLLTGETGTGKEFLPKLFMKHLPDITKVLWLSTAQLFREKSLNLNYLDIKLVHLQVR